MSFNRKVKQIILIALLGMSVIACGRKRFSDNELKSMAREKVKEIDEMMATKKSEEVKETEGMNEINETEENITPIRIEKTPIESNLSNSIDFTGYKSSYKNGYKQVVVNHLHLRDKKIKVDKNKWITAELTKKIYIDKDFFTSKGMEVRGVNAGLELYTDDDYETYCKRYKEDDGGWQTASLKKREASAIDEFDRYLGLFVSANVRKDKKMCEPSNFRFDGVKGKYEGEDYDAICQIEYDGVKAITVLFKDAKIDLNHDCENLNPTRLIFDETEFNGKKYAFIWSGKMNDERTMIYDNAGVCFSLIVEDKEYKILNTDENDDINADSTNINIGGFLLRNKNEAEIVYAPQSNYYKTYFYDEEDYDSYISETFSNNVRDIDVGEGEQLLAGFGLEEHGVYKDGKLVSVQYEPDSKRGKYKELTYDFQILIKDDDKIIARALFKNLWVY